MMKRFIHLVRLGLIVASIFRDFIDAVGLTTRTDDEIIVRYPKGHQIVTPIIAVRRTWDLP